MADEDTKEETDVDAGWSSGKIKAAKPAEVNPLDQEEDDEDEDEEGGKPKREPKWYEQGVNPLDQEEDEDEEDGEEGTTLEDSDDDSDDSDDVEDEEPKTDDGDGDSALGEDDEVEQRRKKREALLAAARERRKKAEEAAAEAKAKAANSDFERDSSRSEECVKEPEPDPQETLKDLFEERVVDWFESDKIDDVPRFMEEADDRTDVLVFFHQEAGVREREGNYPQLTPLYTFIRVCAYRALESRGKANLVDQNGHGGYSQSFVEARAALTSRRFRSSMPTPPGLSAVQGTPGDDAEPESEPPEAQPDPEFDAKRLIEVWTKAGISQDELRKLGLHLLWTLWSLLNRLHSANEPTPPERSLYREFSQYVLFELAARGEMKTVLQSAYQSEPAYDLDLECLQWFMDHSQAHYANETDSVRRQAVRHARLEVAKAFSGVSATDSPTQRDPGTTPTHVSATEAEVLPRHADPPVQSEQDPYVDGQLTPLAAPPQQIQQPQGVTWQATAVYALIGVLATLIVAMLVYGPPVR